MDLVTSAALQSRDDVLGWRLEQSDNVCDEFVFALDSAESIESLSADVATLLDISGLEHGLFGSLSKLFYGLGGYVAYVAEHDCRVARERRVEVGELTIDSFDSFFDESVLDDHELDFLLVAETTELAGFLSVETFDVNEIEMSVVLDGFGQLFYESCFIFFPHDYVVNGSTMCLGLTTDFVVDMNARAHGT